MMMVWTTEFGEGCWAGHRREARIWPAEQAAGYVWRSCRTWRAPRDGTVRLTGAVAEALARGTRASACILRNRGNPASPDDDVELWRWTEEAGEPRHDITTAVRAGDAVRCRLEYDGNTGVRRAWDPKIQYIGAR
jgi:hypothetical protein